MASSAMTNLNLPRADEPNVAGWLARLCERRQVVSRRATALRLVWLAGAGLLAVLLADASMSLPAWARLAVLAALITIGAAAAAISWRRPTTADATARQRLARELDRQHRPTRDLLLNALLLTDDAQHGDDALTRELARRSVRQGAAAMEQVDLARAVDREALSREAGRLWAVAVAWLVVLLIQPGVVGRGLERVGLPWADVPAFSLTRLAVTMSPAEPTMGDDVQVRVTVAGVMPDASPHLIETAPAGRRRWPMRAMPQADGEAGQRWAHTFRALREPVRFRIEAGEATTRWHVAYLAPADDVVTADAAAAAPPRTARAEPSDEATLSDHLATLHNLMQQAAALRDLAEALAAADGLDAATRQAMLDALRDEIATFAADAAALAEAVAAVAATMGEPWHSELLALAAQLRHLALPTAPDDVAAVRAAAEADRAALSAIGEGLADRLAGALSRAGETTDLPPTWADPAARGTYDMTMDAGSPDTAAALRAFADQAPPAYRLLVERYFRALHEEAQP